MSTNRQVILAKRPAPGLITPDVFAVKDAPLAEPGEGEIRVRIAYISLDPAMRGWINEGRSYVPPVAIGGVMRSFSVGIVDASRNPAFKDEVPIFYINVVLDEGVIVESKLVGPNKEKVKLGDRVKVVFEPTHDPGIKLPCFELA